MWAAAFVSTHLHSRNVFGELVADVHVSWLLGWQLCVMLFVCNGLLVSGCCAGRVASCLAVDDVWPRKSQCVGEHIRANIMDISCFVPRVFLRVSGNLQTEPAETCTCIRCHAVFCVLSGNLLIFVFNWSQADVNSVFKGAWPCKLQ